MNSICFKASPHNRKSVFLTQQKGSSSVLVIMVMLMLITFAVLAMMSSYSNYKIAEKNALWTQGFYELESEAEVHLDTAIKAIEESRLEVNVEQERSDLLFYNLITEKLFEQESEYLKVEFLESSVEAPFKIRLTTKSKRDERYFDAEIMVNGIDKEDPIYVLSAWGERPKVFEYADEIQYKDPEGDK